MWHENPCFDTSAISCVSCISRLFLMSRKAFKANMEYLYEAPTNLEALPEWSQEKIYRWPDRTPRSIREAGN